MAFVARGPGGILVPEEAAASAAPPAGWGRLYSLADGTLHFLNDAGADTTLGGRLVVSLSQSHGSVAWSSQPSALTEYNGATRTRVKVDLAPYTQARLTCSISTVGASTAEYRVQYATDGDTQSAWAYLDGAAGPAVNISVAGGRASAFVPLVAGARADVWLRVVGINGNGTASPVVGNISLFLK